MSAEQRQKLNSLINKRKQPIKPNKKQYEQPPPSPPSEELDERSKNLLYTIQDVEIYNEKQALKKARQDVGFTDFTQIAHKKYLSCISELKLAGQDPKTRLSNAIIQQDEKRKQFSRRRAFLEDDDVTYINERNMKFNKKVARSYDKYTADIKANFERGTAL